MESRDDGGKKGGEIFVQLSLKLQDFCIEWQGCSTCFRPYVVILDNKAQKTELT